MLSGQNLMPAGSSSQVDGPSLIEDGRTATVLKTDLYFQSSETSPSWSSPMEPIEVLYIF